MSILLNSISWILITTIGWRLIKPIATKLTKLEHLSLGLLVGAGLHSVLYFLVLKFSDNVFLHYYLFPVELLFSLILDRLTKSHKTDFNLKLKQDSKYVVYIGLAFAAFILGYTWAQATYWPVYEPDAIHLYDYRAQRLLVNDKTVLYEPIPYEHNSQYPPFTSLFHLFSYQNGLSNPKSLYPILFTAWYVCLVGILLRKTKSPILAVWGANIIIASPNIWWQSFQAMTNVPYMIYLSLGGIYLTEIDNNRFSIIISAILVAYATFIRLEPIWLSSVIFLIVIGIKNRNIYPLIIWLLTIAIHQYVWRSLGPKNDTLPQQVIGEIMQFSSRKNIQELFKSFPIAINFYKIYYLPTSILFLIGIITTFFRSKSISHIQLFGFCVITTLVFGIINIYFRDPHWYEYTDSIRRMMIVVVTIIWIGFIQEFSIIINKL